MKLVQSIQIKQTTKLFNGKYKYKIVLVTKTAAWFRGANFGHVKTMASVVDMSTHAHWARGITDSEKEYAIKLAKESNRLLTVLSSNTENKLKEIIKEDLKSKKHTLYVNLITGNKVNRFITTKVDIQFSNLITVFESFKWK